MSRHSFKTEYLESPVEVVLGWDRPLRCFFMTVERLNVGLDPADQHDSDEPQGPDFLYSNLDEGAAFRLPLDHYRDVLKRYGLQVPERMFIEVNNDRIANVGNRNVEYTAV